MVRRFVHPNINHCNVTGRAGCVPRRVGALWALAGSAASNDSSPSPQGSLQCADLSGSAYLECQQNVTPAANTKNKSFKMVRPKPRNGNVGGMGS